MVARLALCAGYISDAETLAYIRAAAIEAQQAFSSWEDYGRHYLKGLERWAGRPIKAYEKAVDFLLKDPGSPWRRLEWHARLIHPEFEKGGKRPPGRTRILETCPGWKSGPDGPDCGHSYRDLVGAAIKRQPFWPDGRATKLLYPKLRTGNFPS